MTDDELRCALMPEWLSWDRGRRLTPDHVRQLARIRHLTDAAGDPVATLVPWEVFQEILRRLRR